MDGYTALRRVQRLVVLFGAALRAGQGRATRPPQSNAPKPTKKGTTYSRSAQSPKAQNVSRARRVARGDAVRRFPWISEQC
jgi:hypothetical protein